MSTYPGENPQSPEGRPPADNGESTASDPGSEPGAEPGTEPTQPVGYWERQAAEQARAQRQQGDPDPSAAQGGAVFNPTTAQSSYQSSYGQPYGPSYGQPQYQPPAYGQPPYAQAPYGQAPYGQAPYGQPQHGQPYAQTPYGYPPYAGFTPPRPDHPQSTLSLILGIVGLVFGFGCGLGFLVSPFAWALGRNAVREVRASHGHLGGEGTARAGMILGIIGTVLLVLAILALIGFAVLVAVSDTTTGSSV